MADENKYNVTSEQGTNYEFIREQAVNEAWHSLVAISDPAGMNSVSIELDIECSAPTISHANFVDSFVERYSTKLWKSIEPYFQSYLGETSAEVPSKLIALSIHLPAELDNPPVWSLQYSFEIEDAYEIGLIIDFQGEKITNAGLAD